MSRNEKIGLVGSGFIGRSWAMLFASVGYEVYLYDIKTEQVSSALEDILHQLRNLEKSGMLRGTASADEQHKLIKGVSSLKECVEGAKHVQESVFEDLELKKKVFKDIDQFAGPNTILSTSASCIVPSKISADLVHRSNFIVAHPTNPPYYVPMVEVVPAPWTSKDVVTRTQALMKEIGQSPVTFSREHPGFGSNRIQYAILNECNNLVKGGILSADDVDTLVRDGLGFRYAFMGPLETAVLNANGMKDYIDRYGSTIMSVSSTFEEVPTWTPQGSAEVIKQMDELIPSDKHSERQDWRNARLVMLAKLKKEMKEMEKME